MKRVQGLASTTTAAAAGVTPRPAAPVPFRHANAAAPLRSAPAWRPHFPARPAAVPTLPSANKPSRRWPPQHARWPSVTDPSDYDPNDDDDSDRGASPPEREVKGVMEADVGEKGGEEGEAPTSLAALSGAHSSPMPSRQHGRQQKEQQRGPPCTTPLAAPQALAAAAAPPAASDSFRGPGQQPPRGTHLVVRSTSITGDSIASAASSSRSTINSSGSGSGFSVLAPVANLDPYRTQIQDADLGPESALPDPGPPRHPPVAFRTAVELRRMLQERQASAPLAMAVMAATGDGAAAAPPPPTLPPPPQRRVSDPRGPASAEGALPSPFAPASTPTDLAPGYADTASTCYSTGGVTVSTGSSSSSVCHVATGWTATVAPSSRWQGGGGRGGDTADGITDPQWMVGVVGGLTPESGSCGRVAASSGGDGGRGDGVSAAPPGVPYRATSAPHPAGAPELLEGDLEEDRDYQKAKRQALSLLQRTPLSSRELSRRLTARGYPEHLLAPLLSWLVAGGALNDRRYARLYAQSKWNSHLAAPAKIKKELAAQGVAEADVAAALAHVFGPSRRIRLTLGEDTTPEERDVREALLAGARRHVEQRGGATSPAAAHSSSSSLLPLASSRRSAPSLGNRAGAAGGLEGGGGGGPRSGSGCNRMEAAAAAAKERDARRRRLATWLQYRGHEMDVVLKVFQLLKV